jgi:hypothetical protein
MRLRHAPGTVWYRLGEVRQAFTGEQQAVLPVACSSGALSWLGVPHSQALVWDTPTGWIDVASGASALTV